MFSPQPLLKEGTRNLQGLEEAVYRNITACKEIAQLVGTCYGPDGLAKFIVTPHGKLVFTNDAGTMMRELGVDHPAAKLIVTYAEQQKRLMGDGSGWVALMTGELLTLAEGLLRIGLTPGQVIEGYRQAGIKALELLSRQHFIGDLDRILKAALTSKQAGQTELLMTLVKQTLEIIKPRPDAASILGPTLENVRFVKILGGFLHQSSVFQGMVFCREPEGSIKSVKNAKVAIYSCPIGAGRTEAKGTVLFSSAQEMLGFGPGEERIIQDQIRAIAQSGVKAIISGDSFSDTALHFIDQAEMLALRISGKHDLRRVARVLGATPLARLGVPFEEELGQASSIKQVEIGADRCVIIEGSPDRCSLATIILRGSNPNAMDSIEQSLENALSCARVFYEVDKRVVPGAGIVEQNLMKALSEFASACPGVPQYSIQAFAEAFDSIPRMLSNNAGGQLEEDSEDVQDLYAVKRTALTHVIDATLTILGIDQIIMSKPANPNAPAPRAPAPIDAD